MTTILDANEIIKRGVDYWNEYVSKLADDELEKAEFEIKIVEEQFSSVDLEGYDFSSIRFVKCRFESCTFSDCKWGAVVFEKCHFKATVLMGGDSYGLKLHACEADGCKFEGLSMGEGGFRDSLFTNCEFEYCDCEADEFTKCVFMDCIIIKSEFEECEFELCNMHSCSLWGNIFKSCEFDGMSMIGFDILKMRGGCSARFPVDHDVSERYLEEERRPDGSVFSACRFSNADLIAFDFGESDLALTHFDHCNMHGANLSGCSNVSAGAFAICDMASAYLPAAIEFDHAVNNIRELAGSLQRIAYFCVAFCVSAILSAGVELTAGMAIKVPPLGWELPSNYYASVVGAVVLCLQLTVMIRAENIAAAMSKLPSVLPEVVPLPVHLRDTFLADFAWRFSRVASPKSGFAPRSYWPLAVFVAFMVLYLEFPISLILLLRSVLADDRLTSADIFVAREMASSLLLVIWSVPSVIRSFRGQDIWGRRKRAFN